MSDDQYTHHNVASRRAALQLVQPANTNVNASALRRVSLLTGCVFMLVTLGACLVHQANHNKVTMIDNHCEAQLRGGQADMSCASKVCYRTLQGLPQDKQCSSN